MKLPPDVSIIVPMYQAEQTIERCLDSLLAQTLKSIEIIIVNDGSTDSGPSIVEKYAQKDGRVRQITQQNAGPGAAINTGLKQAKGEYLGLVGADDRVSPEMFEVMYEALRREGAQMSLCLMRNLMIDRSGKRVELDNPAFPEPLTAAVREKLLEWYLNSMYIGLNSVCQKLVARSVFEENNISYPEQFRYAEDQVVSGRLFCAVPSAAIVPRKLYDYIHNEDSYTYAYSVKNAEDVLKNFDDISSEVQKCGYKGTLSNFALSMMFSSLKQVYRAGAGKAEKSKDGDAARLISKWKTLKRQNAWKPQFRGLKIPLAHRIKIIIAYLGLTGFVCFMIDKLRWVPFFKYLA